MVTFPGMAEDVWPLPLRGISVAKTQHRAGVLIQYTYLCENPECFAVAYSQISEEHAREQVAGHICPQVDKYRGLIPTGKTLVQKMWDEADDALDAYKNGKDFKGIHIDKLSAYITGIAEVLTFCTVPCFKVTDDVLRELNRRWRMRAGEIPFAPTPSYSYNPHLDAARSNAITTEVKAKAASKSVPAKKAKPEAKPTEVVLTAEQRKVIRDTYHGGVLEPERLADMFHISVERVVSIAGPKPDETAQQVMIPSALF